MQYFCGQKHGNFFLPVRLISQTYSVSNKNSSHSDFSRNGYFTTAASCWHVSILIPSKISRRSDFSHFSAIFCHLCCVVTSCILMDILMPQATDIYVILHYDMLHCGAHHMFIYTYVLWFYRGVVFTEIRVFNVVHMIRWGQFLIFSVCDCYIACMKMCWTSVMWYWVTNRWHQWLSKYFVAFQRQNIA